MQLLVAWLGRGDGFRSCLHSLLPLFSQPVCPCPTWCPAWPQTFHQTLQRRAWHSAPMDMAHMCDTLVMCCCQRGNIEKLSHPLKTQLGCQVIRSLTTLRNHRQGITWKPLMPNVCCSRGISPRLKQQAQHEPEPSFPTPPLFSPRVWLHRLFICALLSLKIISDYLPVQSQKQVDQLLLCFTSGYPSKGRERESGYNGLPGSKTPFWAAESHISESIDHSAVCVSSRPWSCLQPCKIITVLMSVR